MVTVACVKTSAPYLVSVMFAFTGNTQPEVEDASHAPELPVPPLKFVNELLKIEYGAAVLSPTRKKCQGDGRA